MDIATNFDFVAPEIIMDYKITRVADWFSLGGIIFWMMTGKKPFESKEKFLTIKNICSKKV